MLKRISNNTHRSKDAREHTFFLVKDFERAELKDSLFGPDLPSIQQQTFENMIENLESSLYNFIKSE